MLNDLGIPKSNNNTGNYSLEHAGQVREQVLLPVVAKSGAVVTQLLDIAVKFVCCLFVSWYTNVFDL